MLGITNVSNAPSIVLKDTIAGDNLKPWVSGSYNGYSYRCAIPITGVTENTIAEVTFSQAQAESGNYSSVCTTYDGGLYIYAKVNTTIEIPSIIIHSIVETYYEMDNSPVSGSTKAVTSGGVYDALAEINSNVVHKTGNEDINGNKTILDRIRLKANFASRNTKPTTFMYQEFQFVNRDDVPIVVLRVQEETNGARVVYLGIWNHSINDYKWIMLGSVDW